MKVIILDRDGVINQDSESYIKNPDEWIPIDGSLTAIARLHHAGYRVVVATNQAGIGRGLFDIDMLNGIHEKMHKMVHEAGGHIDAVFFCPDANQDSDCRKPNPGMLKDIAQRLNIELNHVPVVGDALRDIQAAQAVKAKPILVRTGKGAGTLAGLKDTKGLGIFDDLKATVDFILSSQSE